MVNNNIFDEEVLDQWPSEIQELSQDKLELKRIKNKSQGENWKGLYRPRNAPSLIRK